MPTTGENAVDLPSFRQKMINGSSTEISLYFHIPFCSKKCSYCHFFVLPDRQDLKKQFLEALSIEWEKTLPLLAGKKIVSIYLGGGTPSLLSPEELARVLELPFKTGQVALDAEVTIEINPENVSPSFAKDLQDLPINRASLGIQSLHASELILLGRKHSSHKAETAVHELFDSGMTNLSVDLMYDLPEQTARSFHHTLTQVARLPIAHLSLYNLTIEPHTFFFKRKKELEPSLPSPELSKALLEEALQVLAQMGLSRYEISAFAKEGAYSRHNTGYWTGRPFLGLGPSAFSYWEGRRFQNIPHLGKYAAALKEGRSPVSFEERLEREQSMRELLSIHLRLIQGVDLALFARQWEGTFDVLKDTLNKLVAQGWLIQEGNFLRLTEEGLFFYDSVAADLI